MAAAAPASSSPSPSPTAFFSPPALPSSITSPSPSVSAPPTVGGGGSAKLEIEMVLVGKAATWRMRGSRNTARNIPAAQTRRRCSLPLLNLRRQTRRLRFSSDAEFCSLDELDDA